MISQRCPRCRSSRIRHGYEPTTFLSKLICRYNLLCDGCNWPFKGFALPGTVGSGRKKRAAPPPAKKDPGRVQVKPPSRDNAAIAIRSAKTEQNLIETKQNSEDALTKNESKNFNHQSPPSTPIENIGVDDGSSDSNHHIALQRTGGTSLSAGDN